MCVVSLGIIVAGIVWHEAKRATHGPAAPTEKRRSATAVTDIMAAVLVRNGV